MEKKKASKGKIILIAIIVFLAIGVISGIANNLAGTTSTNGNSSKKEAVTNNESEETVSMPSEIIWKDEDNMGIANIKLDGTHTKEVIIAEYYTELSTYIDGLDKASLKDYEYIEFVGNVMNDGKIECTIKGNLQMEFVKTSTDLSPANVESNIQDLFIPKPLR